MILHWLAGYSLGRLVTIALGILEFIGMGIMLIGGFGDKNRLPVSVALTTMVMSFCLTVGTLLEANSHWELLGVIISLIGGISGFVSGVLIMRHHMSLRNKTATPIEPFVSSDKIWPPPPTSQGG